MVIFCTRRSALKKFRLYKFMEKIREELNVIVGKELTETFCGQTCGQITFCPQCSRHKRRRKMPVHI
jgi:hypothetical protein